MIEKPKKRRNRGITIIGYTVIAILIICLFSFCYLQKPFAVFITLSSLYIFITFMSCITYHRDYRSGRLDKADYVIYCFASLGAMFLMLICTTFMLAPIILSSKPN